MARIGRKKGATKIVDFLVKKSLYSSKISCGILIALFLGSCGLDPGSAARFHGGGTVKSQDGKAKGTNAGSDAVPGTDSGSGSNTGSGDGLNKGPVYGPDTSVGTTLATTGTADDLCTEAKKDPTISTTFKVHLDIFCDQSRRNAMLAMAYTGSGTPKLYDPQWFSRKTGVDQHPVTVIALRSAIQIDGGNTDAVGTMFRSEVIKSPEDISPNFQPTGLYHNVSGNGAEDVYKFEYIYSDSFVYQAALYVFPMKYGYVIGRNNYNDAGTIAEGASNSSPIEGLVETYFITLPKSDTDKKMEIYMLSDAADDGFQEDGKSAIQSVFLEHVTKSFSNAKNAK